MVDSAQSPKKAREVHHNSKRRKTNRGDFLPTTSSSSFSQAVEGEEDSLPHVRRNESSSLRVTPTRGSQPFDSSLTTHGPLDSEFSSPPVGDLSPASPSPSPKPPEKSDSAAELRDSRTSDPLQQETPRRDLNSWFKRLVHEDSNQNLEAENTQTQPPEISSPPDQELLPFVKAALEPDCNSAISAPNSSFLPWTRLHGVLNHHVVLRLLDEIYHKNPSIVPVLVNAIAPSHGVVRIEESRLCHQFRRTFATLILSNQHSKIHDFVGLGFNDGQLLRFRLINVGEKGEVPGIATEGDATAESRDASSTATKQQEQRQSGDEVLEPKFEELFGGWSTRDIKHFDWYRWQVSPIFLASKDDAKPPRCVHHKLQTPSTILPLLRTNDKPNKEGAYGVVQFYKLHPAQHNLVTNMNKRSSSRNEVPDNFVVAIKSLSNRRRSNEQQEDAFLSEAAFILQLQRCIPSPHLVKLLATIEIPSRPTESKTDPLEPSLSLTGYHLLFEKAERSVQELWEDQGWWDSNTADSEKRSRLTRWVALQCYGLADAIASIHNFSVDDADLESFRGGSIGVHGDIKPANILHFPGPGMMNGDDPAGFGLLQLTDFGLSSFHSKASIAQNRIPANLQQYAAPENEILLSHNRASDMWQLGCFYLDFATWLLKGTSGYNSSVLDRMTEGLFVRACRFSTCVMRDDLEEFHMTINDEVLKHTTKLVVDSESTPFTRELCYLAVNHLVVMRNTDKECTLEDVSYQYAADDIKPRNFGVSDRMPSTQVSEILRKYSAKEFGDAEFESSKHGTFIRFESPRWKRPQLKLPYKQGELRRIREKINNGYTHTDAGFTSPGRAE